MPRNSATSNKSDQVKARVLQTFEHRGVTYAIDDVVDVDEEMLLPFRDSLDADPAAVAHAHQQLKKAARLKELKAEFAAFE